MTLEKINNSITKMHTLYKAVENVLPDYDKVNSSIDSLDIIGKVDKLNKLFLENKNINDHNEIINFFTPVTSILNKLKKENEYHNNEFENNIFFSDFYLIYCFANACASKTNISMKKMLEIDFKSLQDKMNDLSKDAIDMTPIEQFISEQKKFLGVGNKHDIYNLYEKNKNFN